MKIIIISICLLLAIGMLGFGIYGVTKTTKDVNTAGHSYFTLATYAVDVDTAVLMLDKYAEAIVDNGMDSGSVGVYYKIPSYDMANRLDILINGTQFLRDLASKYDKSERLNTVDFSGIGLITKSSDGSSYSMEKYISNLDVGVREYMTANSMYYRMLGFWGIFFVTLGSVFVLTFSIWLPFAICEY